MFSDIPLNQLKAELNQAIAGYSGIYGPVQPAYNPYFSACFFNRNSIFLSQKISRNSVSVCFSAQVNGALYMNTNSSTLP
jgi:hypothetical protein